MAARRTSRIVQTGAFVLVTVLAVVAAPVAVGRAALGSDGHTLSAHRTGSLGALPLSQTVPDEYIVVLKDGAGSPPSVASDMATQYGLTISHVYEVSLKGFAATIHSGQLAAVQADPRVAYVSPNRAVSASGGPVSGGPSIGVAPPPPAPAERVIVQAAPAGAPGNDAFADAMPVRTLPTRLTLSTAEATTQDVEPPLPCMAGPAGKTLWFDLELPADARVRVTTAGSSFDTTLAVYTGSALDALTPVPGACNDDANGATQSDVAFDAVANQPYRVQVGGYAGAGGTLVLDVSTVAESANAPATSSP